MKKVELVNIFECLRTNTLLDIKDFFQFILLTNLLLFLALKSILL